MDILRGRLESRKIEKEIVFNVPERTLLLLLKLKAAWDRNYRITHGSSLNPDWEASKVVKDQADIIALLDKRKGGDELNINFLGELISKYPFLLSTLRSVPCIEAVEKYEGASRSGMKEREVRALVEDLLELIE
jgi:hypothetical protein